MTTSTAPAHRIRLGHVNVSIFANESGEGRTFYNAQFDRAYLDGEDWKNTRSFGRDDLLILAKLADQAHSWIQEQLQLQSAPAANAPEPA